MLSKICKKLFQIEGASDLENFCWAMAFTAIGIYVVFALNDIITGIEWLLGVHF